MEYKINNDTKIDCKLSNTEKKISECKTCPAKKDCKYIEQSIKKDIEILNKIEFKKFLYSQNCPNCKNCLFENKNNIENCKIINKNCTGYKELEEQFYNSNKIYNIDEQQLQKILKEIKEI